MYSWYREGLVDIPIHVLSINVEVLNQLTFDIAAARLSPGHQNEVVDIEI